MLNSSAIKILCVANAADGGATLLEFLAKVSGISVLGVSESAVDVLKALKSKEADVLLVHLGTKDLDGIELIRQLRESHPTVHVLVCTASNKTEDIFAAMNAGADAYVLRDNFSGLESAIRSVKLGTVWLDPGIAKQVLDVIVESSWAQARTLPTGLMTLPLLPQERRVLEDLAGSSCVDGVCMIDPAFLKKLKRYAPQSC